MRQRDKLRIASRGAIVTISVLVQLGLLVWALLFVGLGRSTAAAVALFAAVGLTPWTWWIARRNRRLHANAGSGRSRG